MTLMNRSEIGKGYEYGKDLQSCKIDDILLVERREFRECLGVDFHKFLKSHLVDYSNVKTWKLGETYSEGDKVKLHKCFWIACPQFNENGNMIPLGEPGVSEYWKLGEKFTMDCLNDLWCEGFLHKYIDIMVQIEVGAKQSMPLTAAGWVKNFDGKTETLGAKDIVTRVQLLKDQAAEILRQLDDWIRENQNCGCYDLYKNLDKMACKKCGCEKVHSCTCSTGNCITKKKNHRTIGFA